MCKITPNPPELSERQSTSLNDAARRAIAHYLKSSGNEPPVTGKTNSSLFSVVADVATESLLANAYESLKSANALAIDLSNNLESRDRNLALAMQQLLELGLLLADKALDREYPVN